MGRTCTGLPRCSRSPSTRRSSSRSRRPSRRPGAIEPDQVLPTPHRGRPRPGRRDRPGRGRRLVDAVRGRAHGVGAGVDRDDHRGRHDPDPTGRHAAVRHPGDAAGDLRSRDPPGDLPVVLLRQRHGPVSGTAPPAPSRSPSSRSTPRGSSSPRANELGTVGATAQTVWGSIEPSNVPSAVSLYRFTLPASRAAACGSSTRRSWPTPSAAPAPGAVAVRARRQRAGHAQ